MGLAHCETSGIEFAFSWAELPDSTAAEPALAQMRAALLHHLGGRAAAPTAFAVMGMTENAEALTQAVTGERQARLALFTRGSRVYQLLAQSNKPIAAPVWTEFAGSIKLIN